MDEAWKEFSKKNVPPDADPEQYYMMKSSFYGGAFCFLKMVEGIPEGISDAALEGIMQGLNDEMTAYFDSLTGLKEWPTEKT